MKIVTVVGARPQFIKAAPVSRALHAVGIEEVVMHTGQHYDPSMSAVFFREFGMKEPAYNLGVGSGSHGEQTGRMLVEIEGVIAQEKPDIVLVYGDTNSTLAGALAAAKLGVRVAHVEAGLRSFNRDMPEEINRLVADRLSTILFCPTTGQPINYVPQTSIQFFKVNDDGTATKTGDGEIIYRSENLPAGLYVVQTTFDKPGNWGALVTVTPENAEAYAQQMNFTVGTDSDVPLPGEAAPPSKNLVVTDVAGVGEICSAVPHDDMHTITIEEAVKSGKPSIVLFAAPGFCPSFTCGPDLELVQKIQEKYRDKANFIHIEAPNEIQNHAHDEPVEEDHNQETGHQGVNKPQVKTAEEWGLKTEPWLFILDKDGNVAQRYEGGLTLDEVLPAFEKVVQ